MELISTFAATSNLVAAKVGLMLDGVMPVWFVLTTLAVIFVAFDIRSTPESPVMKWAFVLDRSLRRRRGHGAAARRSYDVP